MAIGIESIGTDVFLLITLIVVLILVLVSINQRKKYLELDVNLQREVKRLEEQQQTIKKLEDNLRDYVMGGKSLTEWKKVKQQMEELSGLPSFTETADEYILKIHLSMTKKDDVRVTGVNRGIRITIESKDNPPLQSLYTTPTDIDISKMKVTYKGNTLEVKAPKAKTQTPSSPPNTTAPEKAGTQ